MTLDLRQPLIVFLPFIAAMLALLIGRFSGRKTGWLMVGSAVVSLVTCLWLLVTTNSELFEYTWSWIPALDVNLRFLADPFGLFFALIISGIGALVGIYSLHYIPDLPNARVGRYYAALIAFMGSMLGIALSDDMIVTFVFWEITSITSFMLIGFWYERDEARKGAFTALQVTALGGLAMLAGFVMIGNAAGTFTISKLAGGGAALEALKASPLFVPALLLILLGAFTKSAQWPFHFWLPGAMVAPTPVSTYLHAATMVKAGIFLVGRMLPIFGTAACWSPILVTIGLITFVYTAYQAFYETDLKAILARTTLSTLGLVMLIYGLKLPEQDALQLFNHAAYKGALFLCVGIIEHATHTRDIRELGGLRHKMPITFWLLTLAALSMAGLPPFFGFLAKESFYGALVNSEVLAFSRTLQWLVVALCVLANAFVFATGFRLIVGLFFGDETEKASHAHEAGKGLWAPASVLVAVAVLMGVLGFTAVPGMIVSGFSSAADAHVHMSLLPWHWHLEPVILSLATIGLGTLIYQNRIVVQSVQNAIKAVLPKMQSLWDRMLDGVTWVATTFSENWQNGSLRWYLRGVLLSFVGIAFYMLYHSGVRLHDIKLNMHHLPWFGVGLCALLCMAVVVVTGARTRLGAAVGLTATGFLTALLFVVYRSPDILLTQILIETVSTIFILLILFFMPAFKPDRMTPGNKLTNAVIAIAVGVAVFLFVLFATSPTYRQADNLAGHYLNRTLDPINGAGGANAVNTIIVDFRAIDTTGEITVLVVVGLLIYGLLRSRRKPSAAPAPVQSG